MLSFPAAFGNGVPRGQSAQAATGEAAMFSSIDEELHDARRVKSHGQEEDLRMALDMVIRRVVEISSLLKASYAKSAELEIQLGVAQSNLKVVMANNEMLEEALKRDQGSGSRNVGWRRSVPPNVKSSTPTNPTTILESTAEGSTPPTPTSTSSSTPGSAGSSPTIPHTASSATSSTSSPSSTASSAPTEQGTSARFFKSFRFSRPTTPQPPQPPGGHNQFVSPSMPSLTSSSTTTDEDLSALASQISSLESQIASLNSQTASLQAEKEAAEKARAESIKAKDSLEAELETLSQALFEEANKMVSTERIQAAERIEEFNDQVKELELEKEALKNALKIVERENQLLRKKHDDHDALPSSRSSSRIGLAPRSRTSSIASLTLNLPPLPLSPSPSSSLASSPVSSPHPELPESIDSGSLKTARPPHTPATPGNRASRAFGPLEAIPISGVEVLRLLELQKQDQDQPPSVPEPGLAPPAVQEQQQQPVVVVKDESSQVLSPPHFVKSPSPVPSVHPWEGLGSGRNPWVSPTGTGS